jgi:hypothetical protein
MHEPSTSKTAERKEKVVEKAAVNQPLLTKRQIQEITTDACATTISAMITVDPRDQEEEDPSANAGDSFGGKRNQIRHKIMKLKSSAAASMAQNKKMGMDSLEINWHSEPLVISAKDIRTLNCVENRND